MKSYEEVTQEQLKKLEEELGIKINIAVEPDIESLTVEQLEEYLGDLECRLSDLEDNEPDAADEEAYDDWEDEYGRIEELIEEVMERLEELRN